MHGQRVHDVENASFTLLVFSTTGGTSKEFPKHLASLISSKRNTSYADTIRCQLCFALLCSAIMCLRGARSHLHHAVKRIESVDLVWAESRLTLDCIFIIYFLDFFLCIVFYFVFSTSVLFIAICTIILC